MHETGHGNFKNRTRILKKQDITIMLNNKEIERETLVGCLDTTPNVINAYALRLYREIVPPIRLYCAAWLNETA